MTIVPDWRRAWRWFSVQAFAVIMAIPFVWMSLPDDVKGFLPEAAEPWVLAALAAIGLFGRLVDQNKATEA
jgi:hypothetical protein